MVVRSTLYRTIGPLSTGNASVPSFSLELKISCVNELFRFSQNFYHIAILSVVLVKQASIKINKT